MLAEAKKATEAAQETVTVTRGIGEAQVRAYLGISAATFRLHSNFGMVAELTIENTGITQATHIHLQYEMTPFEVQSQKAIRADIIIRDLGPRDTHSFAATIHGARGFTERQSWRQTDDTMRLTGRVSYKDVFNRDQALSFSFYAMPNDFDHLRPLKRASEGNQST
jgi:hypothetical protein